MASTNVIYLDNSDHPLMAPYQDMRHRNWTWVSGIFIAEGPLLAERLMQSSFQLHSVLVEHRYAEQYAQMAPADVPILVVPHDVVEQLVGFNFHRGVLACGFRKPELELTSALQIESSDETWLGLVAVNDPENLGGMLRTAAGLGIRRIWLGPGTGDPLSRRALRVSMGNALFLEIYRSASSQAALNTFKQLGVEVVATALTENSMPLEKANRHGPLIVLMGNERHGLPDDVLAVADRCVRIDMQLGTDSLNVSVAAGITLHHFSRIAQFNTKAPSP